MDEAPFGQHDLFIVNEGGVLHVVIVAVAVFAAFIFFLFLVVLLVFVARLLVQTAVHQLAGVFGLRN